MDDLLQSQQEIWSGVVRALSADSVRCLAHGQQAMVLGFEFEEGQVSTVYDMKTVFDEIKGTWCLQRTPTSLKVDIPDVKEKSWRCVKEVCAGMGGIAQGLEAIGFMKVAALDSNPLMCETLQRNGTPGVILGDVLVAADRGALHQTPSPLRCMLKRLGNSNAVHSFWRMSRGSWTPPTSRKAFRSWLGALAWTSCRPC